MRDFLGTIDKQSPLDAKLAEFGNVQRYPALFQNMLYGAIAANKNTVSAAPP